MGCANRKVESSGGISKNLPAKPVQDKLRKEEGLTTSFWDS